MAIKKSTYAKLKSLCYRYCIMDLINEDNKAKTAMSLEISKYNDSKLTEMVMNTFNFPFDFELWDFFMNNKLSDENLALAANVFNIDIDLVKSKIKEYVDNNFKKAITDGQIDLNLVNQLTNIYNGRLSTNKSDKLS